MQEHRENEIAEPRPEKVKHENLVSNKLIRVEFPL